MAKVKIANSKNNEYVPWAILPIGSYCINRQGVIYLIAYPRTLVSLAGPGITYTIAGIDYSEAEKVLLLNTGEKIEIEI